MQNSVLVPEEKCHEYFLISKPSCDIWQSSWISEENNLGSKVVSNSATSNLWLNVGLIHGKPDSLRNCFTFRPHKDQLNILVAFTSLFPSRALLSKASTPYLNTPVFGAERGKEKEQPSAEKWSIQQATAWYSCFWGCSWDSGIAQQEYFCFV